MKRFFALFLTMAMVLSLAACGGKKESAEPAADKNESASTETTNSDWPKKTINIYMTHGAGGDTDYMGRQLATALEGVLGQSVVVSNVTGSNGATRLTALLGGEVDATSLPYSTAADYIANGQLKSLCTCLSKAPDLLPDQKVASETIPELIIDTEYVLLAPKGTPAEIVEAMNAAVLEATSTDEWKTMVNNYCFQNPFVLNVEDTIANLTEQRNLFQSFVPFL